MGFLIGGSQASQQNQISGLQIQSSVLGRAVPIVYGSTRIAPNLIDYDDFKPTGGGSKGGKGLVTGKGGGASSSASVLLALSEGPIAGYGLVWFDKSTDATGNDFTEFTGTYPQPPWATWTSRHPAKALGYTGLAYVAAADYKLGSSGTLPNFNFEVFGFLWNSAGNGFDADPALVVADFLTNADYGAGFPSSRLGELVTNLAEAHTIPGSPFLVSVTNQATFQFNLDVVFAASGQILNCVPATQVPATGQYHFSGGVYAFAAADAGKVVNISYASMASLSYTDGGGASRVTALPTYHGYALSLGLWISPAYEQQTQASQLMDELAKFTDAEWVWSSGALKLVPRGAVAVSGNGNSYTPPASLFTLTDDDYLPNVNASGASASVNDDPLLLSVKRPADLDNVIQIEALDRSNAYVKVPVELDDQARIDIFGRKNAAGSRTGHLFADLNAANVSASLLMIKGAISNFYQFTLDQRYCVLDPMDLVTATDAKLNTHVLRVLEITEQDDGTLLFMAEEYPGNTGGVPLYSFGKPTPFSANNNATAGNVAPPVIFEPTAPLTGDALQVWIGLCGTQSNYGGAETYVSIDGETYADTGQHLSGASTIGSLTASLASVTAAATGPTIDNTNTLAVDVTLSGQTLSSSSMAQALAGASLAYVDGEFIGFATATFVSTGKYNLTGLVRGMYGSPIGAHNAGSQFAYINLTMVRLPYTVDKVGQTLQLKFTSNNVYGGGAQSLDSVGVYTYRIQGTVLFTPLPNVTGFATAFIAGLTQLIWNVPSDFRDLDFEVRLGSTWNSGRVVGRFHNGNGAPILGDGTYWVAAHFLAVGTDLYSPSPVSLTVTGSQITSNVIASYDEGALGWLGSFSNTGISGGDLVLEGTGDLVTAPDVTAITDLVTYGGVASSGTYEIPTAHRVNVGRVTPCQVLMKLGALLGLQIGASDITKIADLVTATDILGIALGARVSAIPQLRLSQDGITFGAWQNWVPGSYSAQAFDARVMLTSSDPGVQALLTDFTFEVDVPDFIQTGTAIAVSSGGTAITFAEPFNGGPNAANVPNLQITVIGGSAGDTVVVSARSLTGFTVQITNAGVGQNRTIDYVAQGF